MSDGGLRRRLRRLHSIGDGEASKDGLALRSPLIGWKSNGWRAASISVPEQHRRRGKDRAFRESNALLARMPLSTVCSAALPEVDVLELRVIAIHLSYLILTGSVHRCDGSKSGFRSPGMKLKEFGCRYRLNNWRFAPLN